MDRATIRQTRSRAAARPLAGREAILGQRQTRSQPVPRLSLETHQLVQIQVGNIFDGGCILARRGVLEVPHSLVSVSKTSGDS